MVCVVVLVFDVLLMIVMVRVLLGDVNEFIFILFVEFCLMFRVMLGFDCLDGRIVISFGLMVFFRRF